MDHKELRAWTASEIDEYDDARLELAEDGKIDCTRVYIKDEADAVITELKEDYHEVRSRLQTANLINDEQKAKADKVLSCLKCLVMRDLIKDCPEKKSAIEIVKEYDLW
jgi:hypothetical protein